MSEAKKETLQEIAAKYLVIMVIMVVLICIGNTINTLTDANKEAYTSILQNLPGLLILLGIAFAGSMLGVMVPKIPTAIWITLIGIILAMPYNPVTSEFVAASVGKIGLLPAATPVLAYAGVSIGKDWIEFKKIGIKGIIVALLVMVGTYVGSAIIAQIILSAQGII